MSAFELNANAYFSIRANALSITIEIFKNETNYIYDSEKKKYRFFQIKVLSQEKKNRVKIDEIFFFQKLRKREKKTFFRQLNSFKLTIMCRKK